MDTSIYITPYRNKQNTLFRRTWVVWRQTLMQTEKFIFPNIPYYLEDELKNTSHFQPFFVDISSEESFRQRDQLVFHESKR